MTKTIRICAVCGAKVTTRRQWLSEKCPGAPGGKSGHLISKPGLLKDAYSPSKRHGS